MKQWLKSFFEDYGATPIICCLVVLGLLMLLAQKILGEGTPLVLVGIGTFIFVGLLIFNPFNIFGKNG
jgi:hypothetical protein